MKKIYITVFFFVLGGLFYANAQDIISLKDGTTIQAKVSRITMTEIEFKRFDNQNGPTIVVPTANVISIKYPNGVVDVINNMYSTEQQNIQTGGVNNYQTSGTSGSQAISGVLTAQLQNILNTMPAITIAGNSLKFQFNGDKWTTLLNGENFSTGTIEFETTATGAILTLKQTHIWPAAAAKTAGNIAGKIPGGAAVGGVLNTAGNVAGSAVGMVEAPGQAIVLEYVAGPPAKLSLVKTTTAPGASNAAAGGGYIIPLGTLKVRPVSDYKSTIQYFINMEDIEGRETEVLSINGTLGSNTVKYSDLYTDDRAIIEKLINGSGIRFKVIGDGKSWALLLQLITDKVYYAATIKTQKNKIVEIDIPYSKLKQPNWGEKKIAFDKNSIMSLTFSMGDANDRKAGKYSIKIFDFEIY